MKLKVIKTYHDRKERKDIPEGTIIERDEDRAKVLINAKVAKKAEPDKQKKSNQT